MSSSVRLADYQALADLRHRIRTFLAFSEAAARDAGLTPQQHQLLLAVKGAPAARPPSIGELAATLLLRHHSTVGLVDRLESLGHLQRARDPADRRRVTLSLTRRGERVLASLTSAHRRELRAHAPALVSALRALLPEGSRS